MAIGSADNTTIQFNVQPSVNQLLRHLKKQEIGLYNCINSVIEDVSFVKEIANIYPSLSLLANLRCGLWYAPNCAGTCYFKSTDGHYGNWGFSNTRLNLHVAHLAAQQGGCLIVDATRRGKTFPDAFTKTIPIWTAVINRSIALVRKQRSTDSSGEETQAVSLPGEPEWDTQLHVPPWISTNEANQISMRLDGWAHELLQVGADVAGLAAALTKPLRPLWVSQRSQIWLNEVTLPADLPFTPIILISASLPNARQRRIARASTTDEGGWTYEYVPGAGDDEESWARGLTPQLLWEHKKELVSAGPDGVHDVVKRIVRQGAAASALQEPAVRQVPGSFSGTPHAHPADGGLHNLAPVGARICQPTAVRCSGNGLYWIGETGVALGALAAGKASDVWSHVDAVLTLGTNEHPSMAEEAKTRIELRRPHTTGAAVHAGDIIDAYEIVGGPSARTVTRYLHLPVQDSKHSRRDLQAHLPAALQFLSHHLCHGRQVLVHDTDGLDLCVCVSVALLIACFGTGPPERFKKPDDSCRTAKLGRPSDYHPPPSDPAPLVPETRVRQELENKQSSSFEGRPCRRQHREQASSQGTAGTALEGSSRSVTALEYVRETSQMARPLSCGKEQRGDGAATAGVTKGDVRQRLALVSSYYPSARPTRGSLKQVFNFFQHQCLTRPQLGNDPSSHLSAL